MIKITKDAMQDIKKQKKRMARELRERNFMKIISLAQEVV